MDTRPCVKVGPYRLVRVHHGGFNAQDTRTGKWLTRSWKVLKEAKLALGFIEAKSLASLR